MDKRFLTFLWSALLVVLLYSVAQQIIVGPRPQPKQDNPVGDQANLDPKKPLEGKAEGEAAQQLADQPPDGGADAPPGKTAASLDAKEEKSSEDPSAANPPVEGATEGTTAGEKGAVATEALGPAKIERRFTLGSLDSSSGHRMLVTFTNRGAAVERVELNLPQYTDVDDLSGYLGHLDLENADGGGCHVRVVGPGTPASLAKSKDVEELGLRGPTYHANAEGIVTVQRPGDVILKVDGESVVDVDEFTARLHRTRPKQSVTLLVRRTDDQGETKEITFTTKLRKRPLEVIQPEPHVIEGDDGEDPLSYRLTLFQVGDTKTPVAADELERLPSLLNGIWDFVEPTEANADPSAIEFRAQLTPAALAAIGVKDGNLELIKRYRLKSKPVPGAVKAPKQSGVSASEAYEISLELEVHNRGASVLPVAYALNGPTGLPLEGWWYAYKVHPTRFGVAGIRDLLFRVQGQSHEMITCANITQHAEKNPKSPNKSLLPNGKDSFRLQYAGGDAQFFSSILFPDPGKNAADPFEGEQGYKFQNAEAVAVGALDTKLRKRTDTSFRLISETRKIEPGEAIRHRYAIYSGPKDPELLDPIGLQECIVYGWFGRVARPMVWILHGLYRLSGSLSYGLAIILLTVLVRGAMYPLGRKMALNAQKMQELAPEIKRIADQYKDDMEKRASAQRELFRKHKYNPLSGCLVMFIQLPVFVGLYRALSVDIKLRQAPLIPGISWCSNLAGPDRLWNWRSSLPDFITSPSGWMGPYLNILPFFSFALMLVHQKMFTPPPQDEQQKMQMQVMNFMMIFFAVMFHKVAAGLCIYFIVSSLWGLSERLLLGKYKPPVPSKGPLFATSGSGKGSRS